MKLPLCKAVFDILIMTWFHRFIVHLHVWWVHWSTNFRHKSIMCTDEGGPFLLI